MLYCIQCGKYKLQWICVHQKHLTLFLLTALTHIFLWYSCQPTGGGWRYLTITTYLQVCTEISTRGENCHFGRCTVWYLTPLKFLCYPNPTSSGPQHLQVFPNGQSFSMATSVVYLYWPFTTHYNTITYKIRMAHRHTISMCMRQWLISQIWHKPMTPQTTQTRMCCCIS